MGELHSLSVYFFFPHLGRKPPPTSRWSIPTKMQPKMSDALLSCRHMPSHASREILIVFGSLTSCDPGDIFDTVKVLQTVWFRTLLVASGDLVQLCLQCAHWSVFFQTSSEAFSEAFQGVSATGDIAEKCGDNLCPIHRQPTTTDRTRTTICGSPLLISTTRHLFALLFRQRRSSQVV